MDSVMLSQTPERGQRPSVINYSDLLADTKQMEAILKRETTYLRAHKIEKVKELEEEKMRVLKRLEIQKKIISREPEILQGFTRDEYQALKEHQLSLEATMKENYNEVLKAREVNRRVVEGIAHAVADHFTRQQGYNKKGAERGGYRPDAGMPSLALNETI